MSKDKTDRPITPVIGGILLTAACVILVALVYYLRIFPSKTVVQAQILTFPTIATVTGTPWVSLTPFQPLPTSTVTLTPTRTQTPTDTPVPTLTQTKTATSTTQVDTPVPTPIDWSLVPAWYYIEGVVGHPQVFNLDCEARSASDLAGFFGITVDAMDFLNFLPKSDDPNEGFVGNYFDARGQIPPASYGVYAVPVARLLRAYGLPAYAKQFMTYDELRLEISSGRPVMVWVIGQVEPGIPLSYTPSNGNRTTVANYEHTVLVTGYDEDHVYVIDPTDNLFYRRKVDQFIDSWRVLNYMAVVVVRE